MPARAGSGLDPRGGSERECCVAWNHRRGALESSRTLANGPLELQTVSSTWRTTGDTGRSARALATDSGRAPTGVMHTPVRGLSPMTRRDRREEGRAVGVG